MNAIEVEVAVTLAEVVLTDHAILSNVIKLGRDTTHGFQDSLLGCLLASKQLSHLASVQFSEAFEANADRLHVELYQLLQKWRTVGPNQFYLGDLMSFAECCAASFGFPNTIKLFGAKRKELNLVVNDVSTDSGHVYRSWIRKEWTLVSQVASVVKKEKNQTFLKILLSAGVDCSKGVSGNLKRLYLYEVSQCNALEFAAYPPNAFKSYPPNENTNLEAARVLISTGVRWHTLYNAAVYNKSYWHIRLLQRASNSLIRTSCKCFGYVEGADDAIALSLKVPFN